MTKNIEIRLRILLLIAVSAILLCSGTAYAKKRYDVTLTPRTNGITVSWPKKDGAATYKIYRADVTSTWDDGCPIPKFKYFKKIKTRKAGGKTSFTDKKVKSGHYYAYVLRAYSKKGKKIADTYAPDYMSYAIKGLGIPSVGNNGYGENHLNTRKRLYLYIQEDYAGIPSKDAKVQIYRKSGGGKYKKIASVRMKDGAVEYTDKDITPGKTYTYRVKLEKKVGGKTIKSNYSNTVTIPAVDFDAKYQVTNFTPAGTYTDRDSLDIEIGLAGKGKYSGVTRILPGAGEYHGGPAKQDPHIYELHFKEYSSDRVTWKAIPESGVELPKTGSTLYFRGTILRGEETAIRYCGSEKDTISEIFSDYGIVRYYGPGAGPTYATLDLVGGTGRAYMEFD